MTTVAFDGQYLAVDRQGTYCGIPLLTTKLIREPNGALLTGVGDLSLIHQMMEWWRTSAPAKDFPVMTEKFSATLIVAANERVIWYNESPSPLEVEGPFFAWGSGKEVALGVMDVLFGTPAWRDPEDEPSPYYPSFTPAAQRAIEAASRWDIYTGLGVDCMRVTRA